MDPGIIYQMMMMMIGLNPGPRARTVKPGPRHLRTRPDPGQIPTRAYLRGRLASAFILIRLILRLIN